VLVVVGAVIADDYRDGVRLTKLVERR